METHNRLKELRAITNTKQIELAIRIGLHPSRLSQIENAWVEPREDERARIAKALGVTESEIFPEKR